MILQFIESLCPIADTTSLKNPTGIFRVIPQRVHIFAGGIHREITHD